MIINNLFLLYCTNQSATVAHFRYHVVAIYLNLSEFILNAPLECKEKTNDQNRERSKQAPMNNIDTDQSLLTRAWRKYSNHRNGKELYYKVERMLTPQFSSCIRDKEHYFRVRYSDGFVEYLPESFILNDVIVPESEAFQQRSKEANL
jgi:hypothetical protein